MEKELLIKVRAIQAERGLCQQVAENNSGEVCPHGALLNVLEISDPSATLAPLMDLARTLDFETLHAMYAWTDKPGRTKDEVLARMDKAIEAME